MGDGQTPSLLLICDNGTVLWPYYCHHVLVVSTKTTVGLHRPRKTPDRPIPRLNLLVSLAMAHPLPRSSAKNVLRQCIVDLEGLNWIEYQTTRYPKQQQDPIPIHCCTDGRIYEKYEHENIQITESVIQ